MGLLLDFAFVFLCSELVCYAHKTDEKFVSVKDPYIEVIEFYNISSERNFSVPVLEKIIHDFFERIHCDEDTKDDEVDTRTCHDNYCMDMNSLLAALGEENVTHVTEEIFEEISIILLELAIGLNKSCHSDIFITKEIYETYRRDLRTRFKGDNDVEAVQLISLQQSLELLSLEDSHSNHDDDETAGEEHHHEDDETAGEEHHEDDETAGEEQHHEDDETAEEEHHQESELLFKEKCIGADVVFGQLGFDSDSHVSLDDVGKIAALVIYHIVDGAEISRKCRRVPRKDFFFKELGHKYGNGNNSINTEGLANIMADLQIGGAHEEIQTDEHGHDHKRKKRADSVDIFYEASWETMCYTSEQLQSIFLIDADEIISREKFNALCPALVQQKLSGVCTQSESKSTSEWKRPSKTESYGYGSLAGIIVCLCSVFGAFFVKFSSDKAYDIIMALFLGLAVGTLFTDSMIHLLPLALGIHGHSEEESHDHGGDGIVVEEFVLFSLTACAALYFFYLFEKTLTFVRRQNYHSHGMSDVQDNEITISKAEKYSLDTESKDNPEDPRKQSKKHMSSIAIMVLMGDAVHNFADGVAIGAAFSTSLTLGLSTSIAVFCHELPHELGDFAILLASGVSFVRALCLNAFVSLTAMIGLYVGLAISDDERMKQWIVAVAAGLFIYISLVDMMPQLLRRSAHGLRDFLLNNIGILVGAGAMVTLAIFEEKISVSV